MHFEFFNIGENCLSMLDGDLFTIKNNQIKAISGDIGNQMSYPFVAFVQKKNK